ncbi:hypothetical protein T4B_6121 [Trichinella pseudospiralis]|uniref:G-protein coupled receptors family 1 profile domain-containing protein n=1 Tax=Trichinella pseudospiralis TaxID=6337 RepID=A0A0V1JFN3_TRIPS|nr:hypothetical protein T4B_6121 [Trichinella pseudospiralis]KRZ43895.1 hypothetical protein T4C_8133 [Trichinella pseudospiralis]
MICTPVNVCKSTESVIIVCKKQSIIYSLSQISKHSLCSHSVLLPTFLNELTQRTNRKRYVRTCSNVYTGNLSDRNFKIGKCITGNAFCKIYSTEAKVGISIKVVESQITWEKMRHSFTSIFLTNQLQKESLIKEYQQYISCRGFSYRQNKQLRLLIDLLINLMLLSYSLQTFLKMANTSFNISDLVNQNGETVPLHSEHDKLIDYTIMCLAVLAVIVNSSLLFSMCKNNTIKNRIFIAAYAIGTGTTGLAFVIGYYYRIINHDVRFHTTSLRICMTKTPHISLYVVGDTLMAISILCMSVERLLSVHLAMHFRHLNSKIHLLLIVTTFLWPTIQLLAVWFSIADPEHWNSKVPAVCFLRTTVPKRTYAVHNFISCISGAVSVVFLITAVLCLHYRKAEIASVRSVQFSSLSP